MTIMCAALLAQTATLAVVEIYAEVVKDEGGSELVLVLRREVRVIAEWHGASGEIIIGLRYMSYFCPPEQ